MVINSDLALYILIPLDGLLYFVLINGYLKYKKLFKIPKVASPAEAFTFFETSYKELFPQDQDGFTWGEAITKANNLAKLKDFEWDQVQKSLRDYEAFRYGGIETQQIETYPILKLAVTMREKSYLG